MSFICTRIKNHSHIFVLTPALQVEVTCPGARGCNNNHTPRRKNTHRPTNPQPSHESPSLPPPPYYSTRHTEARNSVKVEWQKKKTKPRGGGGGKTLNQRKRRGEDQEKRYATRTERHANKASSATQTQHRHLPWPPHA